MTSVAPRCFIASWPDAAARRALAALTRDLYAANPELQPVAADNLHCTLAFVGALAVPRAAALARRLRRIVEPPDVRRHDDAPHVWRLDRLGWFAGPRVLWIGGADDAHIAALAQEVRTLLDEAGIAYDRKPFAAHVTLARGLRTPPALPAGVPAFAPILWALAAPELAVSERDASGALCYRRWPAAGPVRKLGR